MTSLNQIQEALSTRKPGLFEKFRIKSLAVFGSFARNEQKPDSDIDMLVEFNSPIGIEFIDLAEHLESILGHRVDLVSRNGIKPKYFNEIKHDLRYV